MARTHRRSVSTLLVLVLLSTGLAGCFDGKDQDDPDDAPSPWETGDPIPIERYQELYGTNTPDECQGCIPLEVREPEPVAPPPPPKPVHIPLPHIGDRLTIRGEANEYPTEQRSFLPLDPDHRYELSLAVEEGDAERVRFVSSFDPTPWHDLPVVVEQATWNVSLASRTVEDVRLDGAAWVSDGWSTRDGPVAIHMEPPLETLFWLGAHLWGRDLQTGDRFASHWLVPPEDGLLRFDYFVIRADRDNVFSSSAGFHTPHGRAESPAFDAQVRAEVTDRYGNMGRWTFYLDEDWPYPRQVQGRLNELADAGRFDVPILANEQIIHPYERAQEDPGWGKDVVRPFGSPEPEDTGFVLGDRMASPVLDELPAYRLTTAISDLRGFEETYATYAQRHPDHVLIAAEYSVNDLHSLAGLRHTWRLDFADRDGGVSGWAVARISIDGHFVPAPERFGPAGGTWSPVADLLARDPDLRPRLATGAPGAASLRAQGIDQVERLSYELRLVGESTIGGIVQASSYRGDSLLPEPVGYGHFVQDLATRRVIELGTGTS